MDQKVGLDVNWFCITSELELICRPLQYFVGPKILEKFCSISVTNIKHRLEFLSGICPYLGRVRALNSSIQTFSRANSVSSRRPFDKGELIFCMLASRLKQISGFRFAICQPLRLQVCVKRQSACPLKRCNLSRWPLNELQNNTM